MIKAESILLTNNSSVFFNSPFKELLLIIIHFDIDEKILLHYEEAIYL
jgi:hypothetical protein